MKTRSLAYRFGLAGASIWLWIFVVACKPPVTPEAPIPTATQVAASTPTDTPTDTPTNTPGEDGGLEALLPSPPPEAPAPHGLGEVSLPDNEDAINRLFNDLPSMFQGRPLSVDPGPTGEINASYGTTEPAGCGTVGLKATDVSTGDFFPEGWTAEKAIALYTTGADWNVEDFGRDGDLYWVEWNTTCTTDGQNGTDTIFTTSWGKLSSPWMFSALAGASDPRRGLIGEFRTAAIGLSRAG